MEPVRYENGCAIFYTSQIDEYGFPELYGFTRYMVLNDTESLPVYDFTMEMERRRRPIHRYNRVERFTFILAQLLGLRGDVDSAIVDEIRANVPNPNWDTVRAYLKQEKKRFLYNRIPVILGALGAEKPIKIKITNALFHNMVNDFRSLQEIVMMQTNDRKYFPSLRFFALKILEMNGAELSVPFMRTRKKRQDLESLWGLL